MDSSEFPTCFSVAGHGRSGSSLITAMLQQAGVDVGERLMAGNFSNERGHFEDLDFYDFHVEALTRHNCRDDGFVLNHGVPVPQDMVPKAEQLLAARRSLGRAWAWKEPRTTLFLDFWGQMIPECRFIFLIRPPWEMIDSLYRRGDPVYQASPALAVRVLENYNRIVLGYFDRFPERCIVIESVEAARQPAAFAEVLLEKFGVSLNFENTIFEPGLLRVDKSNEDRQFLGHFFPDVVAQFDQLRSRAVLVRPPSEPMVESERLRLDWAMRHWANGRLVEAELRRRG